MAEVRIGRYWYVSPLTRRILAVNAAALLVFLLGLLYTGEYEQKLIDSELAALQAQGRYFASAMVFAGLEPVEDGEAVLAGDLAPGVFHAIGFGSSAPGNLFEARVLLFDKAGKVLFDSDDLPGHDGGAKAAAPDEDAAWSFRGALRAVLDRLPDTLRLPSFPQGQDASRADGWPGAVHALHGVGKRNAFRGADGEVVLSAVEPVEIPGNAPGNVLGAVYLLRDGHDVSAAVWGVKMAILRAFLAAFLVAVLLSVYLSETIVAPIVRLAAAADRVRQSMLYRDSIPDLSWRGDEIGDLTRAFREMTAALDARLDAVSRFAADVAHEIKNPLASVKSAIETFAVVKDEAQRAQLLAVVNHDVGRINRLITDISSASRLDSELLHAERETVDLAVLLQGSVEAERSRIEDGGKILLYLEEGRRLPVTGNEVQLGQVVHNLIDNALSFVSEEGKITVSAGLKGDKVYMHIDDAGPGIPDNKLEAVFERFYSARPQGESFGMHSGLGLSISRQIVRNHGGELTAHNLKDKAGAVHGVRFTMLLPAGAGTK